MPGLNSAMSQAKASNGANPAPTNSWAARVQTKKQTAPEKPVSAPEKPVSVPTVAPSPLPVEKIAVPAVASSSPSPAPQESNGLQISSVPRGSIVSVVPVEGNAVEGTLYLYDAKSHVLLLELSQENGKDYVMFNVANIRSFTEVRKASGQMQMHFRKADPSVLSAKEEKNRSERKADSLKLGHGVSSEAQTIFDGIDKMHSCKWQQKTILVMDSVSINPPYTSNDVTGQPEQAVQRIRKVLEEVRKRLKL